MGVEEALSGGFSDRPETEPPGELCKVRGISSARKATVSFIAVE